MRFTIFTGAALVSAAIAVEINAVTPATLKAGGQATIKYQPASPAATIILRKGKSGALDTISTLTNSATGGNVVVNIPSDIESDDDYTFEIDQAGAAPNFWVFFPVTGGVAATSSAASSAASSSAASSASVSSATSVVTISTTASASASASAGGNQTISSATLSTTGATGKPTSSATTTGGVPNGTGAASTLGSSPLALVFGAVAAMAYLG
jgi:hypothetical protein